MGECCVFVVFVSLYNNKHEIADTKPLDLYFPAVVTATTTVTNTRNCEHLNTVPPSRTTLQTETRLPPQCSFVLEMPRLRVLRLSEIKIQIFLQRLRLPSDCSCGYSCPSQPVSSTQTEATLAAQEQMLHRFLL